MQDSEEARLGEWLRAEVSGRIHELASQSRRQSEVLVALGKDYDALAEKVQHIDKELSVRTRYLEMADSLQSRMDSLESSPSPRVASNPDTVKWVVAGVVASIIGVSLILVIGPEVKSLIAAYIETL